MNMTENPTTPTTGYYADTIAPTQSLAAATAEKRSPGGDTLDALLVDLGYVPGTVDSGTVCQNAL